jgi:hypothetical protein
MKKSRAMKLYIKLMTESLRTTPIEAKTLVNCLEQITGTKHPKS